MFTDLEILKLLIPLVSASGGAAWAGVRVALNGTRRQVTRLEDKVDQLAKDHTELRQQFAHLCGQLGV